MLGHSRCGAISATLEELRTPSERQSRNLRAIVDRVRPSVEALLATDLRHDPEALVWSSLTGSPRLDRPGSGPHLLFIRHRDPRRMLRSPFLDELDNARNILVAGAGGGFDIFSGLPLYFGLRAAGKNVHLASLSFSFLPRGEAWIAPSLMKVTADTPCPTKYFPERFLAQWFRRQGAETPIYCFEPAGVRPLLAGYRSLADSLSLDTIVLVDGGTDSLMRGDEDGLGTPQEDISSITAVYDLDVERKFLACLGFGVDAFHGVCHAHFLEAVAELTRNHGFLGMISLLQAMPEVQQYRMATEAVFAAMPEHVSIVSSSILSALAGYYGDHHATPRTEFSELWINPFMPVYWCFRLAPVAERVLYREALRETESYRDVTAVIEQFRASCPTIRPSKGLPV